jgi:hypothetical protein
MFFFFHQVATSADTPRIPPLVAVCVSNNTLKRRESGQDRQYLHLLYYAPDQSGISMVPISSASSRIGSTDRKIVASGAVEAP